MCGRKAGDFTTASSERFRARPSGGWTKLSHPMIRETTMESPSRRSVLYDWKPDREKDRSAVLQFIYWRFPDQQRLEALRDELRLSQEHLSELMREGHGSSIAASRSRLSVKRLEAEIAELRKTGQFPR
jgi:hypothetical protein